MHMLSVPCPLLIWRFWCPSPNGPCLHLFSQGYWACCSFPAFSDGSHLSPAVLVSQTGSHGHKAKALLATLTIKLGANEHRIPVFVQFLSFGQQVWDHHHLGPMLLSSPGPHAPNSHTQNLVITHSRSLCQHHWCPCGWTAKGLQRNLRSLSTVLHIWGQNSNRPTHREILMSDLWQSHTPALSSSWSSVKAAHFSCWEVQLGYHQWRDTCNY